MVRAKSARSSTRSAFVFICYNHLPGGTLAFTYSSQSYLLGHHGSWAWQRAVSYSTVHAAFLLREPPTVIAVDYLSLTIWRHCGGRQNFVGGRSKIHGTQIREKVEFLLFASWPRNTDEFFWRYFERSWSTYSSKLCSRLCKPEDLLLALPEFGMIH